MQPDIAQLRDKSKRITAILACVATVAACTQQGPTGLADGMGGQPHAIDEYFGRATLSTLRIGGVGGQDDSWTISILEVAPTRYDVSSGHFDHRSVSVAAVIRHGDTTVQFLGERNGRRLCLVDSELLLGNAGSLGALSLEGFTRRMSALNRGGGAAECRQTRLTLRGMRDVLFVLSPRCPVASAVESAAEPFGTMIEPKPVIRRVLREVWPDNHFLLLAMIGEPPGSHPVIGAGVAAVRTARRFEGGVPAHCPWPTKREFAIRIAEALEACGTTLEQAPEGELADVLNRASGLQLDAGAWRQMMVDCFGSLERTEAALCFLPEVEFTPFLVVSTTPGPVLFGAWWMPSDWTSACGAHRYRCITMPLPTEDDSRQVSLNIWRYPTDGGEPHHFDGGFEPMSGADLPTRSP
jgi:hypothetical protein